MPRCELLAIRFPQTPTAIKSAEGHRLADLLEAAGLKNGVVQDKLWLSGQGVGMVPMRPVTLLRMIGMGCVVTRWLALSCWR